MIASRYILFLLLVGMLSCRPKQISLLELQQYPLDPQHGLIKSVDKGNTVLEMYYKPKDLILAQELDGVTSPGEQASIRKRLDSLDYFVLRLSRNGQQIENGYVSVPETHVKVVNYLSYNMAENLYMICGKDTLSVLDIAYAPTFGATAATNVMAVFKSNLKQSGASPTICFDDTVLGTGLTEFEFKNTDISNTPTLKLN